MLFTLAFNYDTPIHQLCLESLLKYNPDAKVFYSRDEVAQLPGGREFVDQFAPLSDVHFSDVFRVWYLIENGGTWVDADQIHMRPFEFPYERPVDAVCFTYEDHTRTDITQCVTHCDLPNNFFLKRMFERQCNLFRDKGPAGLAYLDLGAWCIGYLMASEGLVPFVAPHWEYHYLAWYSKTRFLEEAKWEDFQYNRHIYSPNSYCWHLTNAVLSYGLAQSREQLLSGRSFLSFLLRRSATDGFDGTPHKAILERLPDHSGEYRYAEIGVYEGATAAVIGQQRNNARVYAVDLWKNESSDEYRRTGDFMAHASDADHERNFRTYMDNTWFLHSQKRIETYRESSLSASRKFHDNSLDMVFIDADHSYSGAVNDIALWSPKVKPGGWIAGHDYGDPRFPGVTRAVQELSERLGLPIEPSSGNTWFIRKVSPCE